MKHVVIILLSLCVGLFCAQANAQVVVQSGLCNKGAEGSFTTDPDGLLCAGDTLCLASNSIKSACCTGTGTGTCGSNTNCTGAGTAVGTCCSGAGTGVCASNEGVASCVGVTNPSPCCTGAGTGTSCSNLGLAITGVTAGNLLVINVQRNAANITPAVTEPKQSSTVNGRALQASSGTPNEFQGIYDITATSGGTYTPIEISTGAAVSAVITWQEISGLGLFDQAATKKNAASTTMIGAGPTLTLASGNEFNIAVAGTTGTQTTFGSISGGTNFSSGAVVTNASSFNGVTPPIVVYDGLATTTGAVTAPNVGVMSSSGPNLTSIVTYQVAATATATATATPTPTATATATNTATATATATNTATATATATNTATATDTATATATPTPTATPTCTVPCPTTIACSGGKFAEGGMSSCGDGSN
jgi:hypothetical protein